MQIVSNGDNLHEISNPVLFSQKTGLDISCKLSPMETICLKYQILFSVKNKKHIVSLLSAEFVHRVVKFVTDSFVFQIQETILSRL